MGRKLRYCLALMAGFFGGQLAAQALLATAARSGSNLGGEALAIIAMPLLLWLGFTMGYDTRRMSTYRKGYNDGYAEGTAEHKQPTI